MYPIAIHFSLPLRCIITVYSSQKYNLGSNFPANHWRCCIANVRWCATLLMEPHDEAERFFFFHGKHCFSTVIPVGLTPPALLTSVIPAPPQGSDLCNQRLVPRMHCVSKALVDWYDHILPETIESLELDFPLVRSSLSYPKTGFGFL